MTRLKYLDPADGQYKLLPVGGGTGGGPDEVTISPDAPGSPYTDLWVDTDAPAPVVDWSVADNRYLASGFRNQFRNGDMQIAQRGNGPWTTNGYMADGWQQTFTGGAVSTSRVPQAPGAGPPLMVTTVSGQSAANHYASFMQAIEDVNTFSGQTVTMSFSMKAASGAPKVCVELQQVFGTGGSPSPTVTTLVKDQLAISTTLSRYSFTFTVPSVAGKTLGANGNSHLLVIINYSLGSNYAPGEGTIGVQNNTFSITDVQLEAGNTASPFERLPVQQQLAWCQRYFQRMGGSNPNVLYGAYDVIGQGPVTAATTGLVVLQYAPKRTIPGLSLNGPSYFQWWNGGVSGTGATIVFSNISASNTRASMSGMSGLAAGQLLHLALTDINGYVDISAEL